MAHRQKKEPEDLDSAQVISTRKHRRRIQKDPDLAVVIASATDIVVTPEFVAMLDKYYTSTRDRATGQTKYIGGVRVDYSDLRKMSEHCGKAVLKIMAYRNHVLDMRHKISDFLNVAKRAERVAEEIIYEKYYGVIVSRGAQPIQKVFVNSIMEPVLEKVEDLTHLLSKIDLCLKNLDHSYYSVREIDASTKSFIARSEGGYATYRNS